MTTTETKPTVAQFHLPTKPYTVIDAINRHAAGQGSVGYAQAAADADYNGHHITVGWNSYRKYYIAEYFWGERIVIARGTAEEVLAAAVHEFNEHQGRGAALSVHLKPEDAHISAKFNLLPGSEGPQPWRTELHGEIIGAAMYERNGLAPAFGFLANSKTLAEYNAKLEAHFADRRARIAGAK